MRRLALAGLAVLLVQDALAAEAILRETSRRTNIQGAVELAVKRTRNVLVDLRPLRDPATTAVTFDFFRDVRLDVIIERREELPSDRGLVLVLSGRVRNQPASTAAFAILNNVVVGNVTLEKGRMYRLRYGGIGSVHTVIEADARRFPPEGNSVPLKPAADTVPLAACSDPPDQVDVLVLYTATTRTAAGGHDAIVATAYLALFETNEAYRISQVTHRLYLSHIAETPYVETGNSHTDVLTMFNHAGVFTTLPALRGKYAADVVMMLIENGGPDNCGLANQRPLPLAPYDRAYGAVVRSCATGNYSFGHEIGHTMSADHDCAALGGTCSLHNHGYTKAGAWKTIMSRAKNIQRIQYFSNPVVTYQGSATGTAVLENNARALNEAAASTANLRCLSDTPVGNVWMKDTWNDTGAQPDPLTANEDMWVSPYIWIRREPDPGFLKQHQHQNPKFGMTNYVYVKLHNNGNATSGQLELRVADANSGGLSWPSEWKPVTGTPVPVTNFAAHSTRIVQVPWSDLPGVGHYCMVARWLSPSDPIPPSADTGSINVNTRASNNIVWRNLNIVDLQGMMKAETKFVVSSPSAFGTQSLMIRGPRGDAARSFLRHGRLTVRFDDTLMSAWQSGGMAGSGFTPGAGSTFVINPLGARFDKIALAPGQRGVVTLTFERTKTPKGTYAVDAVQLIQAEGRFETLLGGVSYEINAR